MLYIKTAFLQGYKINRETYVMPPTKANTNVQQLKECIYGLEDALCKSYCRVKTHLLFIGLVMLKADTALLYYHDNNYLIYMIAIAIHVDNFLWSETNDFKTILFRNSQISSCLEKKTNLFFNHSSFQYLGINLMENDSKITTDQINYTKTLATIMSTIKLTQKIFYSLIQEN